MAKKTKAKRAPSPYNICVGNAMRGKGGSKDGVKSSFKEAAAVCKNQSKKPGPSQAYKCAYCKRTISLKEAQDVDEIAQGIADADAEELEEIYDALGEAKERTGDFVHKSKKLGYDVLNICNGCFDEARETFENTTDGFNEDDDSEDISYDAESNTQTIDYDIKEIPDANIIYYPDESRLIIESRGSGDAEYDNVENPMQFLKKQYPQKK